MPVTQVDASRQVKDASVTNDKLAGSIALSKLAEAVIQADGGQAFTADQPMGGFKITGLGTPTANGDAATKSYVDGVAQGLDPKGSVKALATTNITLSGTQTIDGVALSADDRVLLTGQNTVAENGLWVVSGGAWTRPTDFDSAGDVSEGAYVFVEEGTSYEGMGFVLTELAGTFGGGYTTQTWQQFTGAGQITAGDGLTKTGNTLAVNPGDGVEINSDAVRVKLDGATLTRSGSGLKVTDGTYAAATHSHASTDVTDFAEAVSDQVGTMVTGNTESGITVAYQDADNTLDFTVTDSPLLEGQNSAYHLDRANHTGDINGPLLIDEPSNAETAPTLTVQGNDGSVQEALMELKNDAGFSFLRFLNTDSWGPALEVIDGPGGTSSLEIFASSTSGAADGGYISVTAGGDVKLGQTGNQLGFLGAAPVEQQTADSVADLWTALKAYGLLDTASDAPTIPDTEAIQDIIGAMVSGNTETNITVTYDDTNGKLDFVASGGGSTRIVRETPSGAVNGSNTDYVLANDMVSGSEEVFLNGILQEPGAGNDYTIAENTNVWTITFLSAPVTGDRIRVSYVQA